jgi:hypothetical protein
LPGKICALRGFTCWSTKLAVFVLDTCNKPLTPCCEKRARLCNRRREGMAKTRAFEPAVGEVETLAGRQFRSAEIEAGATADYCRTKLTAHGSQAAIACLPRAAQSFKPGGWCRPPCQTAGGPQSTSGASAVLMPAVFERGRCG